MHVNQYTITLNQQRINKHHHTSEQNLPKSTNIYT